MPLFDNASNSKIIDSILHDIQGQFPNVEEYEAVLGALFDRLKNIVLEINGQRSQAPLTTTGVENVNSACERVDEVVTTLAAKDLAWRQSNTGKIVSQLQAAEDAVALAKHTLQLDGILDTHAQAQQTQHDPTKPGKMMITDVPGEKIVAAKHFLVLSKSVEGNKQLLAETELVKFLIDLIDAAAPQGKSVAVECLGNMSLSDNGKTSLLAKPGLVTALADMLESTIATIDGKSKTIKCLQNLAQSDDGRQQLLEEYGLVRSLAQMLVPTTVDGRKLPAVAAECLQILAQSEYGKECLLEEPKLVESLSHMLNSNIPDDKVAAARCFEHLLIFDEVVKTAMYLGITHALADMIATASADTKSVAAGCLSFIIPANSSIVSNSPQLVRSLTNMIAKGTPDGKFKAAQCVHAIGATKWGRIKLGEESELKRCLERMMSTAAPDGKNMALQCLEMLALS